jgi:hypothetical protein
MLLRLAAGSEAQAQRDPEAASQMRRFAPGIHAAYLNGALISGGLTEFSTGVGAYAVAEFPVYEALRLAAGGGVEVFDAEVFYPLFATVTVRPVRERRVAVVFDAGHAFSRHDDYDGHPYEWKGGRMTAVGLRWGVPLSGNAALAVSVKYRHQVAHLRFSGPQETHFENRLQYALLATGLGITF